MEEYECCGECQRAPGTQLGNPCRSRENICEERERDHLREEAEDNFVLRDCLDFISGESACLRRSNVRRNVQPKWQCKGRKVNDGGEREGKKPQERSLK